MDDLTLRVEKDGDQYHAWCPELVGCHTYGKTVAEALKHLGNAIKLYMEII